MSMWAVFFGSIMNTLYKLLSKLLWKIGDSIEASGSFPYGNCIVKYSLSENNDSIEVQNPIKGTFLDNIAEWLLLNIGDRGSEPYNQWNEHGFRDEADYLNYKFG